MEKSIQIKTPDKHVIYGILAFPKKRSSTLLIFVHGLTGHSQEHIFYNGARFFTKHDIATFRFDLYTEAKGGRKLTNCNISTHARDLDTVIRFFRKRFKKIFVAGHSLGGITVLLSHTDSVDGIILWDSSGRFQNRFRKWFAYNKHLKMYIIRWGTECLLSKKMYDEWKQFPQPKLAIAKVHKPLKVIVAGKGILKEAGKEYFKYAKTPKEFAIIKGANHNFNEGDTALQLFNETLHFIKRFL